MDAGLLLHFRVGGERQKRLIPIQPIVEAMLRYCLLLFPLR
jgi:hypothetical protein